MGLVSARFRRLTNPLHEIDAPAHYYFIRKILGEGVGAATHLWPNDEYYPPLFHLLAAGMIKLASLFGVNLSIYAAFNTVWLATSGLVWPIAIQLYASYFTRRLSHSAQSVCSPICERTKVLGPQCRVCRSSAIPRDTRAHHPRSPSLPPRTPSKCWLPVR